MRSATAAPSSSALWASIGPRTTSPIAHTLGRFVRQFSSTAIKPRSSSLSPTPSALRPLVLGTRPMETMSLSKAALCALPCASVYSTATSFFAFTPVILTPSSILSPCLVKIFQASFAICSSAAPRKAGSASRIVTSEPRRPHAAHLQADDAGADDAQALRYLGNFERSGIAENQFLVESRPRQRSRVRSRRHDHVLRGESFVLRALDGDFTAVRAGLHEAAAAVEERDLVLLEQVDDAVVARLHHLVLAPEHLGEIELEALHAHAVIGEVMPGLLEVLGGLHQGLGRDAADVGARAPQGGLSVGAPPIVHAGCLEAELRGADRGDVTARAAADHYDVKRLSHEVIGKSIRPLPAPAELKWGVLHFVKRQCCPSNGRWRSRPATSNSAICWPLGNSMNSKSARRAFSRYSR